MANLDIPAKEVTQAREFLQAKLGISSNSTVPTADFKTGLEILEYINGKPAEKITLAGNLMPVVPFSYGGNLRKTKTYYAGNAEPSVQILGTEEKDVKIKGMFKDKRYQDPTFRGVAYEISKRIDALRLRGNLVRISLGEHWVRYGYLDESHFDLETLARISYELTFTIVSFTEPTKTYIVGDAKKVPVEINQELIAAAEAFQATYSSIPSEIPTSLSTELNGIVSDVASVIGKVTSYIDDVLSTVEDVQQALNKAKSLVQYAIDKVQQYRRRIGNIVMSAENFGNPIPTRYANATFLYGMSHETTSLSAYLAQLKERLAALTATLPLARHLVQDGDTLHTLAAKYYNDAKLWELIYKHNNLSSSILTAGTVLEIPRL